MRSLLAIVGLAAILLAVRAYGHSFDPKPLTDKLTQTPILNPNQPDIQDAARAINHVEDGANEKIEEGKRLKAEIEKKAKDAGIPVTEKVTN